MPNFRTFEDACNYFDKIPAFIEATRAALRGDALTIGGLIAKAIGGTEEDFDEFHILYHIEEDGSRGVAGLFFDATSLKWTACTEL